jgi:Bacterial Ig-like domain (group 3)/FG-GAP-like repeat
MLPFSTATPQTGSPSKVETVSGLRRWFTRKGLAVTGLLAGVAFAATLPLTAQKAQTAKTPTQNPTLDRQNGDAHAAHRNQDVQSPFQRIMAPHLGQILKQSASAHASGRTMAPAQRRTAAATTGTVTANPNFPGFVAALTLPLAAINFNPSPLAQNSEFNHNTLEAAVSGDFNNDGNLDLAVVQADGDLTMILNPGPGGNLASAKVLTPDTTAFVLLPEVIFLTSADLNGDGNLDLIGQDAFHTQLLVWMGNGDGTFQGALPYAITPKSGASWLLGGGFAIVGDFNGDGFPDIATIELSFSGLTELTLLNDGQGNLVAGPETDTQFSGSYSAKFGAGDIVSNGGAPTGIAFAISSIFDNPGTSVVVMKSNGDGSFAPAVEPSAALVPDYYSFSEGSFYATNLTGNFTHAPSLAGKSGKGALPRSTVGTGIATTDFVFLTGDGAVYDVPYSDHGGSYSPNTVNLLVGANSQTAPYTVTSPARPSPLALKGGANDSTPGSNNFTPIPLGEFLNVADMNGDGALDLIVYAEGADYVYLNDGPGTFTTKPTQVLTGVPGYVEPQPGDFSGFTYTSKPSFFEADYTLDSVSLYAGDGTGQFYAAPVVAGASTNGSGYAALGGNIIVEATGDMNGDGLLDVIAEDWTNSATAANGGYPDLVVGINNGGKPGANEASGYTFSTLLPAGHFQAIRGSFVEPLTFANPAGGTNVLIVSVSGITLQTVTNGVAGPANWLLTPGFVSCPFGFADAGDINGDGVNDIVIAYPGDASCGATVQVGSGYYTFLGNADGSFQQPTFTAYGSSLFQARLIDFNGDGLPDLAISDQDFTNAVFGVYTVPNAADGSGSFDIASAFNQAPNYIVSDMVPGDYNQDGKQDLTLAALGVADPNYAPSTHVSEGSQGVLLLPGKGDFTFGSLSLVNAGNFAFWGSYADFNGDGTPDLALAEYGSALDPGDEQVIQPAPLAQILPNLGAGVFGAPVTLYDAEYDFNDFDVTSNPLNNLTDRVYTFTGNFGNSGGNDLLVSGSASTAEFINQGTNNMSLTAAPATVGLGQTVTLFATIKSFANPIPASGTISFWNGSSLLGAAQLNATGSASLATTALPAGADTVTASYSGDPNANPASASTTVDVSSLLADTLTLTASPTQANAGQTVSLTATIGGTGSVMPTGLVTFTINGAQLGSAQWDGSGSATFSTIQLPAGSDTIVVSYAGDTHCSPSSASATVVITALAADTLTVTSSSSTPSQGQALSFTATMAGMGATPPTGLVTFTNNGLFLAAEPVSTSGVAVFSTTQLPAGTNLIAASYPGDVNYAASVGSMTVTVAPLTPALTVTPSLATLSLVQGATGQITLSLAANATFSGAVAFSCAGAPTESTCGINPGSLTLAPGQQGSATVVVATTPPNSTYQAKKTSPSAPWVPGGTGVAIGGVGLFLWPRRRALRKLSLFCVVVLSLVGVGLTGCGSSTKSPSTPPAAPAFAGTPIGTYSLVVSLTSGTTIVTQTISLQVTAPN